jgi:ADP-ribose pyrophosphatase YjhB (NUDIX family)
MPNGPPPALRLRLEPLITPMFRAWWRMSRSLTLGVRGIATDAEGRVLLVRHTYRPGWFLPGGGVERGETAVDALCREMQQEAGVEALSVPRLVGFYSNHRRFANDHVLLFHVTEWRACPPANDGEIAEVGFFARDALPDGATQGTRARLSEVFDGAPLDPHW